MTTKTLELDAVSILLLNRWQSANEKLLALAGVFDTEQFERQLVPGTRTPAAVVRHLGFWNEYVANTLRGRSADGSGNEWAPDIAPTNRELLSMLRQSADEVSTALREVRASSTQAAEQIVPFLEHACEHYGQLVVYARALGIVPPASRT